MSLVNGIVQSAAALGVNPVDLATAISYETAGTFDPTKRGPTTQWGQHRGLIQFGQPQAQKYGVNWDDPIGSQLGADGAVVKYLKDTGVRPGMGLLDIYSAINAGGVGRYGASDANNGGAPGTVRDKVEKQMADHRKKAMALLGGDYQPDPGHMRPATGGNMQGILGAMVPQEDTRTLGERWKDAAKDGSLWDSLAVGLNSMRGQFADPGIAQSSGARMKERKQQAQMNQTADWLRQNGREDLAAALEGGMINGAQAFEMMQPDAPTEGKVVGDMLVDPYTGEVIGDYTQAPEKYQIITGETAAAYGLDPKGAYNVGPDGKISQIGGGGVSVTVENGSEVGTIPQGFELFTDPDTGARSMRPIPGGPEDTSAQDAARQSSNETGGDVIMTAAKRAREAAGDRQLGSFGQSVIGSINPYSDAAEVQRQVDVLKSNATIEALNAMRQQSPTGGALGNVTEGEGKMLAAKAGALDPSSPNFERDLADYTRTLLQTVHGRENGERMFREQWEAPTEMSDDDLLKKYGG